MKITLFLDQTHTFEMCRNISSNASLSPLVWLSSDYPRMGSLCQVRVRLKVDRDETESLVSIKGDVELSTKTDQPITELTEAQPTSFPRSQTSVLHVPLGDWTMLRLGEGQCDITEACVEGMRAKEKCEVRKDLTCMSSTDALEAHRQQATISYLVYIYSNMSKCKYTVGLAIVSLPSR